MSSSFFLDSNEVFYCDVTESAFIMHYVLLLPIANAWCCRQEERIGTAACRGIKPTSGQAEWTATINKIQHKYQFWEEKQELWNNWSTAGIFILMVDSWNG